MRGSSRTISAHIVWNDLRVGISAEDVAWSPDVAADMVNRLHEMWHWSLLEMDRFGMLAHSGEDTAADLLDPQVVRFDDGGDGG